MTQSCSPAVSSKSRILWVDSLKGFLMLLVIAGHIMNCEPIYGAIYSFHMPLFFILSAYTFRPAQTALDWWKRTLRSAVRLLIPALLLTVAAAVLLQLKNGKEVLSIAFVKRVLYSLFFCGGIVGTFQGVIVEPMGMPWFLVALFLLRTAYDLVQLITKKKWLTGAVCALLSVAGVLIIRRELPFSMWTGDIVNDVLIPKAAVWPLCIDLTLTILPLFFAGCVLRKVPLKQNAVRIGTVAFAAWLVTFLLTAFCADSYFDVVCRRYPLYPLCLITALAGSLMLCALFAGTQDRLSLRVLPFIGKHSLILLGVHTLDFLWDFAWLWTGFNPLQIVLRIAADLTVFLLVCLVTGKLRKGAANA